MSAAPEALHAAVLAAIEKRRGLALSTGPWHVEYYGRTLDVLALVAECHEPFLGEDDEVWCIPCAGWSHLYFWPCTQYAAVAKALGVEL